jgi:hypothetical protein
MDISIETLAGDICHIKINTQRAAYLSAIGIHNISEVARDGDVVGRTIDVLTMPAKKYFASLRGGDGLYGPRTKEFDDLIKSDGRAKDGSIYVYTEGGFFNSDYRGDRNISAYAPIGLNKVGAQPIESGAISVEYEQDYLSIDMNRPGNVANTLTSAPFLYYQGKKFTPDKLDDEAYQYVRKKGGPGKLLHANNRNPRGFKILPEGDAKNFHQDDEVMSVLTLSDALRGHANNGTRLDDLSNIAAAFAKSNPTPSVAINLDGGDSVQMGVVEIKNGEVNYIRHIGQSEDVRRNSTFIFLRRNSQDKFDFNYTARMSVDETLNDAHADEFSAQQSPAEFSDLQHVRLLASQLNFSGQISPVPPKPPKRKDQGTEPEPRPTPIQRAQADILDEAEHLLHDSERNQRPLREYLLEHFSAFSGALKKDEKSAEKFIDIVDAYINPSNEKSIHPKFQLGERPQLLVSDASSLKIMRNIFAIKWNEKISVRLSLIIRDGLQRLAHIPPEMQHLYAELKDKTNLSN